MLLDTSAVPLRMEIVHLRSDRLVEVRAAVAVLRMAYTCASHLFEVEIGPDDPLIPFNQLQNAASRATIMEPPPITESSSLPPWLHGPR